MNTFQQALDEGRLIRGKYSDTDAQGRQLLCALTALNGDPGLRPENCPAHLCPQWLAHLLPWMDDSGTQRAWLPAMRRLAAVAPHLGKLHPRVEWQVRALCVREAMRHTMDADVLAVCERVATLCERFGRGEPVDHSELDTATWTTCDARAALWAARAAKWDAESAAESVAESAESAADAAADAAANAAANAAMVAAAATDRLTSAILDAIEADLKEQGVLQ